MPALKRMRFNVGALPSRGRQKTRAKRAFDDPAVCGDHLVNKDKRRYY